MTDPTTPKRVIVQDNHIIVLLCGGDKATQAKDIVQAKTFWKDYLSHE